MVLILPEHSQRPYRYGMTLLCVGAMFNWLGLADNNAEPVRYIGVTLIAAGALLICLAMCFWMKATHDPQVAMVQAEGDNVHHIVTIHQSDSTLEKPPDYDSVTGCLPPSYEDAIKLSPVYLLQGNSAVGSLKPEPGSIQDGQSTSSLNCTPDETDTKPSNTETSQSDNFGSKVLRLSRRFLGRTRSVAQDLETERSTDVVATVDTSASPVR